MNEKIEKALEDLEDAATEYAVLCELKGHEQEADEVQARTEAAVAILRAELAEDECGESLSNADEQAFADIEELIYRGLINWGGNTKPLDAASVAVRHLRSRLATIRVNGAK